jgi:hypothetical protein
MLVYRQNNILSTLEKTEGSVTNGQFREIDNIGHTRHRIKTNKERNTTQETKMLSNTDSQVLFLNQNTHVRVCMPERKSFFLFFSQQGKHS